ncbi:MAG TPA: hypothetical protein VGK67_14020 [Myxococcales bacterium]
MNAPDRRRDNLAAARAAVTKQAENLELGCRSFWNALRGLEGTLTADERQRLELEHAAAFRRLQAEFQRAALLFPVLDEQAARLAVASPAHRTAALASDASRSPVVAPAPAPEPLEPAPAPAREVASAPPWPRYYLDSAPVDEGE